VIIKVRHVDRLIDTDDGKELFGSCDMHKRNKMIITISRRKNKTIDKYGATLLHELLHGWVNVLELHGFETTEDKEHKFIDYIEAVAIRKFLKTFGRK